MLNVGARSERDVKSAGTKSNQVLVSCSTRAAEYLQVIDRLEKIRFSRGWTRNRWRKRSGKNESSRGDLLLAGTPQRAWSTRPGPGSIWYPRISHRARCAHRR